MLGHWKKIFKITCIVIVISCLCLSFFWFLSPEKTESRKFHKHQGPEMYIHMESKPGPRRLLVYNRVPKAASGTMIGLLLELQKMNNFSLQLGTLHHRRMKLNQQVEAIEKMKKLPSPGVQIDHFYFVNFTSYGEEMPMYMNMLRDPVERVLSMFFFNRIRDGVGKLAYSTDDVDDAADDFIACYKRKEPACTYIPGTLELRGKLSIPYFCGNDAYCFLHGSENALKRAKYVIESFYKVVGIVEEYNKTLAVFEDRLPEFFTGAWKVDTNGTRRHSIARDSVEKKIRSIKRELKRNMTIEYELYEFAKQRLLKQYNQIKKKTKLITRDLNN